MGEAAFLCSIAELVTRQVEEARLSFIIAVCFAEVLMLSAVATFQQAVPASVITPASMPWTPSEPAHPYQVLATLVRLCIPSAVGCLQGS